MRRIVSLFPALIVAAAAALAGLPAVPAAATTAAPALVSDRLIRIDAVPGTILDASAARLLFLNSDSPPRLVVLNRGDRTTRTVPAVAGRTASYGWLTPRGAAFITLGPVSTDRRLYDWTGGTSVADLGPLDFSQPRVRGAYLVWQASGGPVKRRNLVTGTTIQVAPGSAIEPDVDASGDVVYDSLLPTTYQNVNRYQIMRFHRGIRSPVTSPAPSVSDLHPIVDGANVVYTEGFYSVASFLSTGSTTVQLGVNEFGSTHFSPPTGDYDAADGWVAYREGGFPESVNVRSPSGVITQIAVTDYNDQFVKVLAVGPNGQTALSHQDHLYLGAPGQPLVDVVSGLGNWAARRDNRPLNRAIYIDGRWLFAIGGELWTIHRCGA